MRSLKKRKERRKLELMEARYPGGRAWGLVGSQPSEPQCGGQFLPPWVGPAHVGLSYPLYSPISGPWFRSQLYHNYLCELQQVSPLCVPRFLICKLGTVLAPLTAL